MPASRNVRVEIFTNLVVEFAKDHEATAIVKGLRAISDFEYEFEMNQLNRKLAPDIESVYIIASPAYSFLSSTGVKEMATFGGDVADLVPAAVAKALAERARTLSFGQELAARAQKQPSTLGNSPLTRKLSA